MLTATRKTDNKQVLARDSEKNEGPFLCPKCRRELNIKKGRVVTHHFAHKPPILCAHGIGQSDSHRSAALAIYDNLRMQPNVTECYVERDLGSNIPDVFAVIDGIKVAIEVQISNLTMDQIISVGWE